MSIDLSALATNANKLAEYINKNEKQEWKKKEKDKQLYCIIERKVKKEKHKREKPRGRDGTLKECKRLLKEGASPEVLTKLEESLREQEKYHRYYVQCFLPVLDEVIKRSKRISNETKNQVISDITKSCLSRYNKQDSGYGSDFEDEVNGISDSDSDFEDEVNEITENNAQLLKAIKSGNNRKFRRYLKDCTNVSGITDEKGNNILHLITSLEKKQKLKFLDTLIKIATEKNLAQLIDSENQEGKTPFQVALIDKIAKEKHESSTTRSSDNTLKFLTKLLDYGAKLSLPTEDLEKLSKKQNEYYRKFLEKLGGKKPETKVEKVIAHAINTSNSNGDYPLHLAIQNKDEKSFKELLQKGADINLQDIDGNNALHLIVKPEIKQKLKLLNILLEAGQEEQFTKAINAKNIAKQTPLHHLFQHIKEKNEDRSCTDKQFEKTNRYKVLELFLQNGADITAQDKEGNNILYHIALLKGEQKISCLNLILDFEKKGIISSEKLHKAINAKNEDDKYPAQIALIKQTEKIPSKLKDFSRRVRSRPTKHYYTAEFCAILLKNGADNKSDHITIPKEHRKQKYYQTIKRIKDITGVSPDQETQKELEERFSKKNAHKNINLPVGWILGGLIFATVFCALAGNMIAAAALSVTIAVCAMCYPVYLKLENHFNAKNSAAQEPSNQPEHTESPATKMSNVSILGQFINKLDGLTNKFSFPGQ